MPTIVESITLDAVTVHRGGRLALDAVSTSFPAGSSTALVGPNGSGKTTLLEVERLEVGNLLDRQVGELSGGQRQRALVAQAVARQAPLLLLDEPITGLDLASQERILGVVDAETAAGHTVVVTTHNLDEARHCGRVLVLDRRLVAEGAPDEVLTPAVLREAYGDRVLGDHAGHDHAHDLLVVDDHGHGPHA